MTPTLESKRRDKLSQNMETSEKQLNNVRIHESFNQFITNVLLKKCERFKSLNYFIKSNRYLLYLIFLELKIKKN